MVHPLPQSIDRKHPTVLVNDAALLLPYIYCTLHFNKFQRCNRCHGESQDSVKVSRKSKRGINHANVSYALSFFASVPTEPQGFVRPPPRQMNTE